jgi:hypothetical protein
VTNLRCRCVRTVIEKEQLRQLHAYVVARRRIETRRRQRSCWRRQWIGRHDQQGAYCNLLQELDDQSYRNFLRMTVRQFDELLLKVTPLIVHQNTNFRCAVSSGERLAI